MSAIKLIRELLHHTQKAFTKRGQRKGKGEEKKKVHAAEMANKTRTKRGRGLDEWTTASTPR